MAYYDTYQGIITAVTETAEDDSQEFLDYIPKSLELAQLRVQDELDAEILNSPVEVTCVPSVRTVLKPSGYRFTNNVFIVNTSGVETPLKKVSTDYLRDYAPNPSVTGFPKYYSTDYNTAYILVAPTPDAAYVLKTDMRVDVPLLSTNNPQNILTQYCGNALFCGLS